ncbi:EAL domain-containing protein [Paraburkholderia tropica]|uniref:EAL domain-containing protein n=1 Tax=Paraburkholderia tropica TaxID=92647 RepID=UPI002AB02B3D|nr:EAL domain-containing protein [Paraburkholderia tropica]
MSASTTYLLVELHNHAHLSAVYGESFADEAMRALQWRVHGWGGSVTNLGTARFLVTLFPDKAATPTMHPRDPISRMERWQVELAAMSFGVDRRLACAVVTVDPVRAGSLGGKGSGFNYPEELERCSASVPQLVPPQFGWQWRMTYEREMALAVAFQQASVQDRVNLALQPVVRYDQPDLVLYQEALLRISGLPGGVGPARLVPVLERLGLIRALDRTVVRTVIGLLEEDSTARLGCNISACSLVADSWWSSIFDRLAAQPDVAARLTIEITETAPIHDFDAAAVFVQRLKSLGCLIALDDFGTGYSSVAFAREIRPDVIKLDARCLRGARKPGPDERVFHHLVSLCQALAPTVIAEGVEHADDVRVAFKAGVDWVQGVLLAPPIACRPRVNVLCDDVRREAQP